MPRIRKKGEVIQTRDTKFAFVQELWWDRLSEAL